MATDERAIGIVRQFQCGRSINQYARDLGIDPGQLWRVLNGEQNANRVVLQLIRMHPDRANEIAADLNGSQPEAVAV